MGHGGSRPVWAFLTGPYALFLLVLLLVPFANIAMYSLHPYSPTKVFLPELTFDNYRRIFDLYYVRLFGRTLRLGLITTAVCVVLGYPLAYCLARARPRWQAMGLFLLIMPLMVSAVIRIFGWIVILGRKGLVNQALMAIGLEPVKLLYSETAVVIGLVNIFVPFMVLPIMASIERIPPSLEEAAQNLGANWYRMFGRVILPLSLPGLISGCLLVYSLSISAFVTPALMGNPRERMVGQQIYDEVLVSFNWPGAASLSFTLVLVTAVLPFVLAVYLGLLAPLVVVIAVSFGPSAVFEFPPRGVTLHWFEAVFASSTFVTAFFRVSLVVGLLAAALATVLGTCAALGLVRFRFFGREAVETFFLAPLLVPEILLGAALYLFYARLAVQASIWTLLCGHLVICTPYVIRSVTAGLVGLDPRLEEAAMSLGATRLQAFFKVTLPLLRSSLLSGAIFAFIISFSDINLALFLSGPQSTSLPVHIFSQIQWQGDPTIAAASTMQIVVIGLMILVVQRIFRLRLLV